MNISNKKVLVVGLGKSGIAASRLLISKGARVWITEKEEDAELRELANSFVQKGVVVELGKHSRGFVEGAELIVICPGVGHDCEVIQWANECKVPVISELELASWYVSCPLIAITGTNGKSTVTSLIEHIFRCSGKDVIACGNIGMPLSEVAMGKNKLDLAVVEVSSFQLEYIDTFQPDTAVWLNFSCDHLDQHYSMENYLESKLNIFKNQEPCDLAVVYTKELNRVKDAVKARIIVFEKNPGVYYGMFRENISAAVKLAEIYGVGSEIIKFALETFKPLPHRLEHVAVIDGVNFVNDSKATNTGSVLGALDSVKAPVVLILGGRDKEDDFGKLRELIQKKVSSVIAIGEARDKIWDQLKSIVLVKKIPELSDAVEYAFKIAAEGSTVLLSPGCSSFDMFKDYKQRGDVFKECVSKLNISKVYC